MKTNRWIVTVVDHGDTCDGKARVLETCKSKEEAEAFVRADIENWADDHASENIEVDFDKMSAYDGSNSCEWNIEKIKVDVEDQFEKIRNVLRTYFDYNDSGEPNPEFDEDFTAQAAIDEIHDIIGDI